ncbi:hypothetical protein FOMPIDRAFT_1129045 [Fomitopsis schrenkii]|uniref:Uncharacterized protein n=1 Tax=Fomitopsis schrenkii TaxID=2126942 RepID=S8DVR5_FOMSC|nr:hypothetical protein FOMPIDRAFT_1129045 [Fomitopsis schrenkii]
MSTEPQKFPSPIGGTPNTHDLAPSIVFIALFALTIPLALYRVFNKKSFVVFIIASAVGSIGRYRRYTNVAICSVVDFSFRAAEAESGHLRTTKFWVNYLQSVYAMGFIGIAGDLANIARVYLLTTTRGSDPAAPEIALTGGMQGQMGTFEVLPDEPTRQAWINRFGLVTLLLRLPAIALGGVYGGVYFDGIKNYGMAVFSQQMRYASDILVLVHLQLTWALLVWALLTRPQRVDRRKALFLVSLCLLLSVPAIYRLGAMANWTDSLLSTAPGSLNSQASKAVFYVLHILPEWIAGTVLLCVNVKQMFGFNNWRS